MTPEQQKRQGIRAGKEAVEGALKYSYLSWLHRQINQCRSLSPRYPYAEGYVIGAIEALAKAKEKR